MVYSGKCTVKGSSQVKAPIIVLAPSPNTVFDEMKWRGWSLALASLLLWLLLNEETHISSSFKLGWIWPHFASCSVSFPSLAAPRLPHHLLSPEACLLCSCSGLQPCLSVLAASLMAWKGLPKVVTSTCLPVPSLNLGPDPVPLLSWLEKQ